MSVLGRRRGIPYLVSSLLGGGGRVKIDFVVDGYTKILSTCSSCEEGRRRNEGMYNYLDYQ